MKDIYFINPYFTKPFSYEISGLITPAEPSLSVYSI